MELQKLVKSLIDRASEGSYWDFKQSWHSDNADLLKDIICMANNTTENMQDGYIIFGIEDKTYKIVGVSGDDNRKNQENVIGFLSSQTWSGEEIPNVDVKSIEIAGKECVVLGRSNIVGKPMAVLMLRENATVTIAHSRTRDLKEVTKRADILIAAVGKPKMITADYVKEGAVVIDVGINRDENGKLCGDVDFESVEPLCSAITPVPGGVGPMTIAMLLNNCLESVRMD